MLRGVSTMRGKSVAGNLLCLAMAWLALCSLFSRSTVAQSSDKRIRRAYLLDGRTQSPPSDRWAAVPIDELQEFLNVVDPEDDRSSPRTVFSRAVFRGAMTDAGALSGQLEAEISKPQDASPWMQLGDVRGSVSDLGWNGQPAIWGTSRDGRVLLFADDNDRPLTGKWSLAGRVVADSIEFEFLLPHCESSRMELRIPNRWQLACHAGHVGVVDGGGDADERLWTIDLGRQSRGILTLEPAVERAAPTLAAERTLRYAVLVDRCRVQADFVVHAYDSVPDSLVFQVPLQLSDLRVTLGGAGLTGRSEPAGGFNRLVVPLPSLPPGKIGPIRIMGEYVYPEDEEWPAPRIVLERSTLISGRRAIEFSSPMRLERLREVALRETNVDADLTGTVWSFEDIREDGELIVRASRRRPELSGRLLQFLDFSGKPTTGTAAVDLRNRSGSTFALTFDVPPHWTVTDVEPAGGADERPIAGWRQTRQGNGSRLLISLGRALTPNSPCRLVVSARLSQRRFDEPDALTPLNFADWQSRTVIRGGLSAEWQRADGWNTASGTSDAGADWSDLASLLGIRGDDDLIWLDGPPKPAGTHLIEAETQGSDNAPRSAPASSDPDESDLRSSARSTPPRIELWLASSITGDSGKWHLHQARFVSSGDLAGQQVRFRLDHPAVLDSVRAAGVTQAVLKATDTYELPSLPGGVREFEVRYRTPASDDGARLRRTVPIVFPELDRDVQQFTWRLDLPASTELTRCPVDSAVWEGARELSWMERVFGPLARDARKARFNPFDGSHWSLLWGRDEQSPRSSSPNSSIPIIVQTVAFPADGKLELWNRDRSRSLAWLAMFTVMTAIAGLRWLQAKRSGAISAFLVVACLLIAVLAPVYYAPIAGGAFVGAIIGSLTPRKWLVRRDLLSRLGPRTGTHSSIARASQIASAVLLAVGMSQQTAGLAQETTPAATTASDSVESQPRWDDVDVLLPPDESSGEPIDFPEGDRGYLHERWWPDFLEWRNREHPRPAYLLSTASYTLTDPTRGKIHAQFSVLLLKPDAPVRVSLALRGVSFESADDCRVDGQPAVLRPAADSQSYLVEIAPRRATADGASQEDAESNAYRNATVEVWFTPIAIEDHSEWTIGLPRIADSRLILPQSISDRRIEPSPVRLAPPQDATAEMSYWSIGFTDTLRVRSRPSAADTERDEPSTDVKAEAVSLVEVHPLKLRVRTRLTLLESSPGSVVSSRRTLHLRLPATAVVREAAGDRLRRFSTRQIQTGETLMSLEFDVPLQAGSLVHLDFAFPPEHRERQIVIPPIPLLGDSAQVQHHVGLVAARGLTLQVDRTASLSEAVDEVLPQLFGSVAPEETGWPEPAEAFLLHHASAIPVLVDRIQPVREARIENSVRLRSHRLEWHAEVTVDVKDAAAFRHEFRLPGAVRVDSVMVVQNQVDRLLDWSRSEDKLLVHLRDGQPGRYEITIDGWSSFEMDEFTPLPALQFPAAQVLASEVVIASPGHLVTLYSSDRTEIDASSVETDSQESSTGPSIRRFSTESGPVPVAFRAVPKTNSLPVDIVTFLVPADGRWRQEMRFFPHESDAHLDRFIVGVSRDDVSRLEDASSESEASRTRTADGDVRIEFVRQKPEEPLHGRLTFGPLDPTAPELAIPRIDLLDMKVGDHLLIVPVDCEYSPGEGGTEAVAEADLNPLLRARLRQIASSPDSRIYRRSEQSEPLVLIRNEAQEPGYVTALEESIVWHATDGGRYGLLTAYIASPDSTSKLEIRVPSGVEIVGSRIDGNDTRFSKIDESTIAIPLQHTHGARVCVAEIDWRTNQGTSGGPEETDDAIPATTGGPPSRRLVIHVPPQSQKLVRIGGKPMLTPREYAWIRAESLLNALGEDWRPDKDNASAAVMKLLDDSLTVIRSAESSDHEKALRSRIALIRERVGGDESRSSPGASPPASTVSSPYATAMGDDRVVLLRAGDSKPSQQFLVIDRSLGRVFFAAGIIMCCLIAGIAMIILRRRMPSGRLIPVNGSYVGMFVAGVLWWMWFHAGTLGLLIALWAAVLQCLTWRRNVGSAAAGS